MNLATLSDAISAVANGDSAWGIPRAQIAVCVKDVLRRVLGLNAHIGPVSVDLENGYVLRITCEKKEAAR